MRALPHNRLGYRLLVALCLFTGLTAMAGGIELMGWPHGTRWLDVSLLRHSPFSTFFGPGLLLFGLVGLTNLLSGILAIRRHRLGEVAGFGGGSALTIWIVVEIAMLRTLSWLQLFYGGVGLLTMATALWLWRGRHAANLRGLAATWLLLGGLGVIGGLWVGCAAPGQLRNQVYTRGNVTYRVGALPAVWQPSHAKGADVVFRNGSGGTVAASAQCPSSEDIPLDVLTNHLLFGFESQVVLERSVLTLDGRQALRTHLRSEFDGVPIELALIVLKKDGCTYDLQLISAPSRFASVQRDFDAFVQGFTTIPTSSGSSQR